MCSLRKPVDKTMLNLTAILIGGMGLFSILYGYDNSLMTSTFWDSNPFQVKHNIVDNVMTNFFYPSQFRVYSLKRCYSSTQTGLMKGCIPRNFIGISS